MRILIFILLLSFGIPLRSANVSASDQKIADLSAPCHTGDLELGNSIDSFKDVFSGYSKNVNPSFAMCNHDVNGLFRFAEDEWPDFDPAKAKAIVITKWNLFGSKKSPYTMFMDEKEEIREVEFHVFPVYDGQVYDYLTGYQGPLANYLEYHFEDSRCVDYELKIMDVANYRRLMQDLSHESTLTTRRKFLRQCRDC